MSSTSNTAGQHELEPKSPETVTPTNITTADNPTALAARLDDQVEKVVMIDGAEVKVKVAAPQAEPRPKVTFCIQGLDKNSRPGTVHYAKIFLPRTHQDAELAAFSCFGELLTYPAYSNKAGTLMDFVLKASIMKNDGTGWAWAHIRPNEWWEIMSELIEENPHLEVGVFPYKD